MLIDIIAGARPNFIKIAPIIDAIQHLRLQGKHIEYRLIHTGQHYGPEMSDNFFFELSIPAPHYNLGIGSVSAASQVAQMIFEYEKILLNKKPDITLVVGDVTSTMACSIAAKKMNVRVAHVEAGLRSFDMSMPEEVNRIVTDAISDYFFTTSKTAVQNLLSTGANRKNIFFVGNTMIDTLYKFEDRCQQPALWNNIGLKKAGYLVLTLHRPANVDNSIKLKQLVENVVANSNGFPVVFPVHPRTAAVLDGLLEQSANLHICKPLSYLEFNYLVKNSMGVITDSGGISEETTVMNVPCLTMRYSTERPETVDIGTNELVGDDAQLLSTKLKQIIDGNWKKGSIPELWDGQAAIRIVTILYELLCNSMPQKPQHELLS